MQFYVLWHYQKGRMKTMKNKKRLFRLRTALLTVLTVALIASAAAFLGASAAESVSPSDVSGSDVTRHISETDVSPSDKSGMKKVLWSRLAGFFAPLFTSEAPQNLGDPVITMTTGKAVGEMLNLEITGIKLSMWTTATARLWLTARATAR